MATGSRILLVDDDPLNVDYLEQELEYLGYETAKAADGREALESVAARAPDLILLDVMMPGVDGFTVCRMLKDDRHTRRIPIVIMTSLNAFEDRIKGIEAGADDFLTKPVKERELVARIRTALKLKHSVDEEIGQLQRVSDHLGKFVPDTVRRLVTANPDAPELHKRERDVSVLFLDISGYSRLSKLLAPEVLHLLVERYFSRFLDRIQEADGEMSETSVDGLMAIFSDADPRKHATDAVDTGLALLADTEALNGENSVHPLAVHIGVNSGLALVGSTRFQGRHGARWVFTADGPVTDLAARMARVAKSGEIIGGPETVRRMGDRYPLRPVESERVKYLDEDIEPALILGPASAKRDFRRAQPEEATRSERSSVERKLAAILAADVVGYSRMMSTKEEETLARLKECRALMEGLIRNHRGRVFGSAGDSIIAEFGGPVDAVRCAVEIQRQLEKHEADIAEDHRIRVRIGVNLGDIMVDGNDLLGDGVNVAARLEELADAAGICISGTVHETVLNKIDIDFQDLGEHQLRNIARPVRVLRVLLGAAESPETAPVATSDLADNEMRFGVCRLNLDSHKLYDDEGAEIPITSMEFDLLKAFADHPNRVLTRDQLLDMAHNRNWEPFDRSIDIRIARIRRKIERDPAKPQVIKTVRGAGYMFATSKQ